MKKTLIALMALASVAMGETPAVVNYNLGQAITLSGYETGDAFSMSFTITGHEKFGNYDTRTVLTLGDGLYLITQVGNYMGINTKDNSNDGMQNKASSLVTDAANKVHTLTVEGKATPTWLSYNDKANGTAAYGLLNATFTLSTDGTDSTIFIDFDGANEYDTKFVMTGYVLNANTFNIADDTFKYVVANSSFTAGGNTYLIPEPATATLSLLALAGLAARRRRR